jgi:hypothetical protein
MKKIIWGILLFYIILGNITFAQVICQNWTQCSNNQHCVCGQNICNCANNTTTTSSSTCINDCLASCNNQYNLSTSQRSHCALCPDCTPNSSSTTTTLTCADFANDIDQINWTCQTGYVAINDISGDQTLSCCIQHTTGTTWSTSSPCYTNNWITVCPDCLLNGQCKLNIYNTLGIRQRTNGSGDATSVGLFVQDIVLSATFFIWTLVTVALVVSGLMYIFAWATGKDPAKAKTGMINSLIGLVIVACSYFIIRLVQYIAKGF